MRPFLVPLLNGSHTWPIFQYPWSSHSFSTQCCTMKFPKCILLFLWSQSFNVLVPISIFSLYLIDGNAHALYPLPPSLSMDVIQVYAIAAGGTISIFVLINLLPYLASLWKYISLFTLKHLTYLYLLHRYRFIGPWSRAEILIQAVYLTVNIFYLNFRVSGVVKTGNRVGTPRSLI